MPIHGVFAPTDCEKEALVRHDHAKRRDGGIRGRIECRPEGEDIACRHIDRRHEPDTHLRDVLAHPIGQTFVQAGLHEKRHEIDIHLVDLDPLAGGKDVVGPKVPRILVDGPLLAVAARVLLELVEPIDHGLELGSGNLVKLRRSRLVDLVEFGPILQVTVGLGGLLSRQVTARAAVGDRHAVWAGHEEALAGAMMAMGERQRLPAAPHVFGIVPIELAHGRCPERGDFLIAASASLSLFGTENFFSPFIEAMLEFRFRTRDSLARLDALVLVAQDELLAETGQNALFGIKAFEGLIAPNEAQPLLGNAVVSVADGRSLLHQQTMHFRVSHENLTAIVLVTHHVAVTVVAQRNVVLSAGRKAVGVVQLHDRVVVNAGRQGVVRHGNLYAPLKTIGRCWRGDQEGAVSQLRSEIRPGPSGTSSPRSMSCHTASRRVPTWRHPRSSSAKRKRPTRRLAMDRAASYSTSSKCSRARRMSWAL